MSRFVVLLACAGALGCATHTACLDGGPAPAYRAEAPDGTCLQGYRWAPAGEARGGVVVVHGIRDHARRYDVLADELAAAGFVVVAQDHRGHGRSGGKHQHFPSVEVLVDDVGLAVSQARQAAPGKPVFLVGHSLGGLVSTAYALDRRAEVAGMVLTGPALKLPDDLSGAEIGAAKLFSRIAPGLRIQPVDDTVFVREAAAKAELAADPLIDHRDLPARSAGAGVRGIPAIEARLGEVDVPLLAIHGGADPATDPAGSRALVDRAASADKELWVVEGAAHDLVHEPEQAEVRARIVAWISARAPSPAPAAPEIPAAAAPEPAAD